jgi:hypothetical protein
MIGDLVWEFQRVLLLARPPCIELCIGNAAKGETGVSDIVCMSR